MQSICQAHLLANQRSPRSLSNVGGWAWRNTHHRW